MTEKNIQVQTKVPLSGLSTFKVGGETSYFIEVQDKFSLKDVLEFARKNNLKIFILGGGSNVLFGDQGFSGLVIKISHKGISDKKADDGFALVTAQAGEAWDEFVAWTLDNGFYGLENLSAIPGFVGASPVQNIGAYGVEVKDFVTEVEVFDTDSNEFRMINNVDCKFGYRYSVFKEKESKNLIVTSVTFKLSLSPAINILYKDLQNYFKDNPNPTPIDIRNALIKIRGGKFPNLNIYGTAGSFFKNIICNKDDISELRNKYPDLPVYEMDDKVKVSTAYILDKICGLKGLKEGNVGLYDNQSLVVVNLGGASATEVKQFIDKIKSIVKTKTGLNIEEEVVLA